MKAFILAAGEGSRLLPLTKRLPKPLVPVNGIPLICYSLARLKLAGINELIINTWYLGDMIAEFLAFHHNFGFNIHISEEKELLGTGGGIAGCKELLDEPFLLINADIICDIDLNDLMDYTERHQYQSILAVSTMGTPTVAIQDNKVVDFSNLRKTDLADNTAYTGNALISPEIFHHLPEGNSSLVTSGMIPLAASGKLNCWLHPGWWLDVGTKQRLSEAEIFLETKKDTYKLLTSMRIIPDEDYLKKIFRDSLEV